MNALRYYFFENKLILNLLLPKALIYGLGFLTFDCKLFIVST